MAIKDLKKSIAETFLTGTGLEVSQRIAETMIRETISKPPTDLTQLLELSLISAQLRKLGEKEAGE